jgi:hypothetical protein
MRIPTRAFTSIQRRREPHFQKSLLWRISTSGRSETRGFEKKSQLTRLMRHSVKSYSIEIHPNIHISLLRIREIFIIVYEWSCADENPLRIKESFSGPREVCCVPPLFRNTCATNSGSRIFVPHIYHPRFPSELWSHPQSKLENPCWEQISYSCTASQIKSSFKYPYLNWTIDSNLNQSKYG